VSTSPRTTSSHESLMSSLAVAPQMTRFPTRLISAATALTASRIGGTAINTASMPKGTKDCQIRIGWRLVKQPRPIPRKHTISKVF